MRTCISSATQIEDSDEAHGAEMSGMQGSRSLGDKGYSTPPTTWLDKGIFSKPVRIGVGIRRANPSSLGAGN